MEAVEESVQDIPGSALKRLKKAIGEDNIKVSKFERVLYSHDLAPLPKEVQLAFKNVPDIVVRPQSTEDIKKIVEIANEHGIPITPRGSSTWGLGGSIPAFGGIMVDMSGGMNKIIDIDRENLCVTAQAGATWEQVYEACLEKGMLLGSYPSSFPSATLAGWISTGGIGVGNYKYGSAADNIRNMEVVTADGTVIETGFDKIVDNGAGYNLNQLFTGAEGTLGIISKVTFKLAPGPEKMKAVAYAFPDLMEAGEPLDEVCKSRIEPLHIWFNDGDHYDMLRKAGKDAPQVGSATLFMLEGDETIVDYEESVLDEIMEKHGGEKLNPDLAQHEWEERCYEFRAREMGVGHIPGEVVVPVNKFSAFARETYDLMYEMKMEGAIIGIMADRNTVMFMPYYFFDPESLMKTSTSFSFNKKFSDLSFKYGGRPVGFGKFFASNLGRIRGDGAEVMKGIKDTLDPDDIMNPGTLIKLVTRHNISIPPQIFEMGMNIMALGKKMIPRENLVDRKAKEYEVERKTSRKKSLHEKKEC